jgi:hypothetical protein
MQTSNTANTSDESAETDPSTLHPADPTGVISSLELQDDSSPSSPSAGEEREPTRLPQSSDRNHLPYTEAVLLESLRWRPAVPLGVPHRSSSTHTTSTLSTSSPSFPVEQEYRIPRGTVIIPNVQAMCMDEKMYRDPGRFEPGRYLPGKGPGGGGKGEVFPGAVFGFGRRICPGRYLATSALWLAVASIITVFEVLPLEGEGGGEGGGEEIEWVSGTTMHPKPFRCRLRMRPGAEKLLA